MIKNIRVALLLALSVQLPLDTATAQAPAAASVAGPRLDVTASALQEPEQESRGLLQARSNSVGKPAALMIVGGAAIILGAVVIENDVGTLFAIGGAIALLYGLYLYLR